MQKIYKYYPEDKDYEIDTFEELEENISYLSKEEKDLVEKAYEKAEKLHRNSPPRVASGKPYITHPLTVANILAHFGIVGAECNVICAALLHDTVEDTDYTIGKLEEDFGKDIAEIVDTVTKISTASNSSMDKEMARIATHRKILECVSKYGRNGILGVILKLADRVHNIQSLDGFKEQKRIRIASETMHIYVPLARISGIYDAKDFLENMSLMNLNPEAFDKYYKLRKKLMKELDELCDEFCDLVTNILAVENIKFYYDLSLKNIYGIYKQIEERNKKIEEINDLIGLKFVVPSKKDCYTTLCAVHSYGTPIKGGFDDYISEPKSNGYRSINTLFRYKGQKMQARIRSVDMEKCNRMGLMYNKNPATEKIITDITTNVKKINKTNPTDEEFVKAAEKTILTPKITIVTPGKKRVEVYDGQTALDYALSSRIVNDISEIETIYVNDDKLDNIEKPFDKKLSDGDLVYVHRKRD